MKLTAILMLVSCMHVAASGFGQQITLAGKDMTLRQIFDEIRKQSGYTFFYFDKDLTNAKNVTLQVKNEELRDVLNIVFQDQFLTYTIINKSIIVKQKGSESNQETPIPSPPIDVRGRIINENGEPLAGITVTVKGTQKATASNDNGFFEMKDVEDNATLVFTGVNVETYEIPIKGRADLATVNLRSKVNPLSEINVTVNTGYQTIARDRAAGAIAKPDLKVMLNRTSTPNILTRLEGLIPGLTVRGPGGLLIRGQSSLNAGTEPLIVIDGIEYGGNILQLNMLDVEEINVLKDATAASIWGAKAANGVIVITTKKAKAGAKLKLDYDGYYAFLGRPDLDYVQRMNTEQFIALNRELFPQYYPYNLNFNGITQIHGTLPHLKILYDRARNLITQQQADSKLDSLASLFNKDQIADLFVRDAASYNQTISVSVGGKSYSFYGSLNHIGTKDNVPGNENNQYKINLNNTFIVGSRFTASVSADLTNLVAKTGNNYNPARTIVPYQMFQDANGNPLDINYLGSMPSGNPYPDSLRALHQARSRLNLNYNPLLERNRGYSTSNGLFARLVGTIKLNLIKGLDYQGTFGYNIENTNIREVRHQNHYGMRLQVLQFAVAANPTVIPVYNLPEIGGRLVATTTATKAWTARNQLFYNRDWKQHKLSLMAGQQATSSTPVSSIATYYGWDDQLQTSRPVDLARLAAGITGAITGTASLGNNVGGGEGRIARTTSYYSTMGYTFKRKYTLNGSWRIDESNLFGRDKSAQNRPVYSIGGIWALGREHFMQRINWLDQLNIRLTYGITGNAPLVGTAASYDILTAQNNVNYVTGAGFILQSPANASLTWEGTKVYNAGFDFSIFKNRLSGSIDVYKKNTKDLIGELAVSPFSGYSFITGNYGNMENKGIEIGLNSVNIRTREFTWRTGFTFAHNKNKLTLLRQNAPTTGAALVGTNRLVGSPLNAVFVYNYGGLNGVGDPQIIRADKTVTAALNVATPADILYMGTTQPVWSGGLQNSFQYKSFELSASIIYNGGHVIRSNQNPTTNEQILANNTLQLGFLDRWKVAGDENRTDIPRYAPSAAIAGARNLSYYTASQRFIMNGAYAKLRDITLAYSLPRVVISKIHAQAVSFRFQVNNLLLWTANDEGMDPEFTGLTRSAQGTVSFGAHVTF